MSGKRSQIKTCERADCGSTFKEFASQPRKFCSRACAAASKRLPRQTPDTKACSKCKVVKPAAAFGVDNRRASGLTPACKECARAYYDARRASGASQAYWRQYHYGISEEGFDELFEAQDGKCAICLETFDEDRPPHTDHCHETKEVRGLLCRWCNHGLGNFHDDAALLDRAIGYLLGLA